MDYSHPVRVLIPGVQGRVLDVLTRTEASITMRHVAELAGVSQSQAAEVLGGLARAGVVNRQDVGRSSLVSLQRTNAAAQVILTLARLREAVVSECRATARRIRPAPLSLVLFGSFARGEAREGSDLDVLVVRPDDFEANDERWLMSIGGWLDRVSQVAGLPVNHLDLDRQALAELDGELRHNIERDEIVLVGLPISTLVADAQPI